MSGITELTAVHQPSVSGWEVLISDLWTPPSKGSSCFPESRKAGSETGSGAITMFHPPDEVWLCVVLWENSWIREASEVIQGNAPKIYLK